ncbi:trimeric intracellular cation channel family protein [Schlesneria sp.]|uniref:trimeric intracellular cation channel family protein n=1 Tax=Schlesneria sp. TaxID=2762018 RepID=UPI002F15B365
MDEPLWQGRGLAAQLLVVFDLLGTFVFALSGAAAGVKNRLDLFGLMFLSFAAGNAGGVARDVLIGAVPPAAIRDWKYVTVSVVAGLVMFLWSPGINLRSWPVLVFDAAGLSLFAVTGTQKALSFGLHPMMAALMGMLTGIGGGMLRDLLVRETPLVLQADIYAVAALAAGVLVATGHTLQLPLSGFLIAGALLCFWLRMMSLYRGWHLPRPLAHSEQE